MKALIVLCILTSGINISYAEEKKMETTNELKTVAHVDLQRYLGKWLPIKAGRERGYTPGSGNIQANLGLPFSQSPL